MFLVERNVRVVEGGGGREREAVPVRIDSFTYDDNIELVGRTVSFLSQEAGEGEGGGGGGRSARGHRQPHL